MDSTFHTVGAKYPQTHPNTAACPAARSESDTQDGRGQIQAQSTEAQNFAASGRCRGQEG